QNWTRDAKVPILVINATTLNTGHVWQFTASWMGEPPIGVDEQVDVARRLRRVYYGEAPEQHRAPRLATAGAASAGAPAIFPPVTLEGLYPEGITVELADGGVHDNQGVASLLEQDCTVILVSDASGQIRDNDHPERHVLGVALRANSILMSRVRGAQVEDLLGRRRSRTLRGVMIVHLKKGLPAEPRDWIGCKEPYEPEYDALPHGVDAQRPPYGIDETVQKALSELRTDLDAFSDDEAYALMATGYAMTRYELERALPDLQPTPKLERSWPFTAMLGTLAATPDGDLVERLQSGRWLLARGWRRRRARRAGRPQSALRRAPGVAVRAPAPG